MTDHTRKRTVTDVVEDGGIRIDEYLHGGFFVEEVDTKGNTVNRIQVYDEEVEPLVVELLGMMGESFEVSLVWKVPSETIETDQYARSGVHPSGELMGVYVDDDAAESAIDRLLRRTPAENAPYTFTTSKRELYSDE